MNLKNLTALFSIFVLITSCIDLDTKPEFHADAFVVTRVFNGDTVYAVDATLSSNLPMKNADISSSSLSTPLNMRSVVYNNTILEYTTPITAYQTSTPQGGNYNFSIKLSDDTNHNKTDVLKNKQLKPFLVNNISFTSNEMAMVFSWDSVVDANLYHVRLLKNDSIIVFNSNFIDKNFRSIKITPTSTGWANNFTPGIDDTLSILTAAILAEMDMNQMLNYQCISFADTTNFVWGK